MLKYEDLTDAQKEFICNGCGGKGGKIKPPHAELFKEDCHYHDYLYYIGCKWWHRIKADWKLRSLMRARIKTTNMVSLRDHLYINDRWLPDFAISQIYYRWADAYCMGVVVVGWKYFYSGPEKRDPGVYLEV